MALLQELKLEIRKGNHNITGFNVAYQNKLDRLFEDLIRDLIQDENGALINIFGSHKTGRTTVARAVAGRTVQGFGLDYDIIYGWSFAKSHNQIKKETILIVEPGEAYKSLLELEDELGAKKYRNSVNVSKSIVILITNTKLNNVDFAIETMKIIEETNQNLVMLHIDDFEMGTLKIRKLNEDFDHKLQLISDKEKAEYFKSEHIKILENIDTTTKKLLSELIFGEKIIFKDALDITKRQNAIKISQLLLYGGPDSGKSTLLDIFNNLFIKKYGEEHVWAVQHAKDPGILMHKGFSDNHDHYIQFLSVEDATFAISKDSQVAEDWVNLRHIMNEKSGGTRADRTGGLQLGACYFALALHKLEGTALPTDLRQQFRQKFFLDVSTNRHDYNLIKNELDQGIYFDFLLYIMGKRQNAIDNDDPVELDKYMGIGVAWTANGIYPFRLHKKDYPRREIKLLAESSRWKDTWEAIRDQLIVKYKKSGIENLKNVIIDNDITMYEWVSYGRIRPQTERGVNYRKVVKDAVRAWHQIYHDTNDEAENNSQTSVVVLNEESNLNYSVEKYYTEIDSTYLELIYELVKNKAVKKRTKDDTLKSLIALAGYLVNYRDVRYSYPELVEQYIGGGPRRTKLSASTVSDYVSFYCNKYQGYDGEVALLEKLGSPWESEGSNSAGADLVNHQDNILISLKVIKTEKDTTTRARKVGKAELEMIRRGYTGELWIYAMMEKTWFKYRIAVLD